MFAVEGAFDFLGPAAEPAVEDADAATLQGEDETAEADDDDDDADELDDLGGNEEGCSVAETCAVEAEPITQAPVRIVFTAPGDRGTYAVRPKVSVVKGLGDTGATGCVLPWPIFTLCRDRLGVELRALGPQDPRTLRFGPGSFPVAGLAVLDMELYVAGGQSVLTGCVFLVPDETHLAWPYPGVLLGRSLLALFQIAEPLGVKEERTHTTTTHTLPMARASAGARGLTTEDGAQSTQTSSSAGSKGVWL